MILQGGSYLLLSVESNILIKEELENISDVVRQLARKEQVRISNIEINLDEIVFRFFKKNSSSSLKKLKPELQKNYRDTRIILNNNFTESVY